MRLAKAATIGLALALVPSAALAGHGSSGGSGLSFTNTPLLRPNGGSEPAITIGSSSTMVAGSLSWQAPFGANIWKGMFGSTPSFQGQIDNNLESGSSGGGDEDFEIGSTGTLHVSTLVVFFNPIGRFNQLGVDAITCPNADTSDIFAHCTKQIIAETNSDREWITSNGKHVWISYHDPFQAALIHMQRSDDDGFTWKRVGDPIVGQGSTTADSTFNNIQGEPQADPTTGIVYDVYASGVTGLLKATTFTPNQVFVSRSLDGGETWSASLAFSEPAGSSFANVFPALAVDPLNGDLYVTASDSHNLFVAKSSDHGLSWSAPQVVNSGAAATAIFPTITARNGTVDLAYYGTAAASKDDPSAVWNVFLAQSTNRGSSFSQSQVTSEPNHVGVVCTSGTRCAAGTRNLLDLFEDAIDPVSGKLAIIYTNDLLTMDSSGNQLPQVELAQQN